MPLKKREDNKVSKSSSEKKLESKISRLKKPATKRKPGASKLIPKQKLSIASPAVKKNLSQKRVPSKLSLRKNNVLRSHAIPERPTPPSKVFIRFPGNPIVEPNVDSSWESRATFNPAAIYVDGRVHLLYRALGDQDISVLGYATSADGFHIESKCIDPAYLPPQWNEVQPLEKISFQSPSGGGTGGSEDPRAVLINGRVYVTYTDFNGWYYMPRVALTSISIQDFLDQKWQWKKPVVISPPFAIHKNWVIFPEKINGKYAILHGIYPKILIEYVDSLDFEEGQIIDSKRPPFDAMQSTKGVWDSRVRGPGPPPIMTKYGWLLLYHATDDRDPGRYKIGAMILDKSDPTKILYRSVMPLLQPDEEYENSGFKAGVVYSCGAVVADGRLIIYYGGADSVVCAASANLDEFLNELMETGAPKISIKKPIVFKKKK